MSTREPGWRLRVNRKRARVPRRVQPWAAVGVFSVALVEREADVLVLNDGDGGGEGEVEGKKDGSGLPTPKGPQRERESMKVG